MKKLIPLYVLLATYLWSCQKESGNINQPANGTPLTDLKNIQYGSNTDTAGNSVALMLDIYFPPAAITSNKYPMAMLIHGGGYKGGDKNGLEAECQQLADSGFVAVSLNYRLGWRSGSLCNGDSTSLNDAIYRGLQDANAALRFLVHKAGEYAIDTAKLFIGGQSAGGNVALNVAYLTQQIAQSRYSSQWSRLGNISNAGNNYTSGFSIKGLCNMWGGLMDSAWINAGNIIPSISFHGTGDNVVNYNYGPFSGCNNYPIIYASMPLYRQGLRYGKPSVVHLSINGGHGPTEFSTNFLMSNMACFFKKIAANTYSGNASYTGVTNSCR